MAYANISYVMSQADYDAVINALGTIVEKMPFLVILDTKEKRAIFKHGAGSTDFTQEALFAAKTFPQVLPASFDMDEYTSDAALFKSVSEIQTIVNSLAEKLNDTQIAIGGEAIRSSLEVYAYIQTAQDRVPGLKSVAERLQIRFKGQGKRAKKKDQNDPPPTPEKGS
jgi:hypothetical protein